jgi:carbohydrate-selective porin OprB
LLNDWSKIMRSKIMRNNPCLFFLAALLTLCAVLFTTNTWAEDSKTWAEDIWTRDKLTGDWRGLRSDLSKHGIDIGLRLSYYGQRVTSGGVDKNGEFGGTMDYRFNFDTNKLFGTWKGFSVNMHARTRFGQDVLADAGGMTLPNTGMLMPLPGDYHDTDITGLIVNQYFPAARSTSASSASAR